MTKLAWYVETEDSGDIVFAESEEQALKVGAYKIGMGDPESIFIVERKPEYDLHSGLGYVPPQVLIADYWEFPCLWCDHSVDEENEHESEEGEVFYPEPVFEGEKVFCCQGCYDAYYADREKRAQAKEAAKRLLLAIVPTAQIKDVSLDHDCVATIDLSVPGCEHRITWQSREPKSFWLVQSDEQAFRAQVVKNG